MKWIKEVDKHKIVSYSCITVIGIYMINHYPTYPDATFDIVLNSELIDIDFEPDSVETCQKLCEKHLLVVHKKLTEYIYGEQ
jgi:hypothetical protein